MQLSVILSGASPRAQSNDLPAGGSQARRIKSAYRSESGACLRRQKVIRLRSRTRSTQDDRVFISRPLFPSLPLSLPWTTTITIPTPTTNAARSKPAAASCGPLSSGPPPVGTLPGFIDKTFAAMNAQAEAQAATQIVTGTDGPILVVLQQAGGNDGLNMLPPWADDALTTPARPTLGHRRRQGVAPQ